MTYGKPLSQAANIPTQQPQNKEIDSSASNPVFQRIRTTLQRTDPIKWRRAGEDFNAHGKHPKPIDVWESLFILSLKEGNLVLRCSIPLRSEYYGGGYTLIPVADPRFSVELREKGWNPRELTDPFYAQSIKKHLKVQRLLEGRMAKALYEEIRQSLIIFTSEKRQSFEIECQQMIDTLPERIAETSFNQWSKDIGDERVIRFGSQIHGMSIDVARVVHNDRISFHLKLGRDGMYKSINSSFVEKIFHAIENLEHHASLEQLNSLLSTLDIDE
jgi:hypothetical protein